MISNHVVGWPPLFVAAFDVEGTRLTDLASCMVVGNAFGQCLVGRFDLYVRSAGTLDSVRVYELGVPDVRYDAAVIGEGEPPPVDRFVVVPLRYVRKGDVLRLELIDLNQK